MLSNSRDFKTIRSDIIESALRKVGAVSQNDSPTTSQYINASVSLNSIVKSLQAEHIFLWETETAEITLVPDTQYYTLQNDTIMVSDVHLIQQNTSTQLEQVSESDYVGIPDKTLQGAPRIYLPKIGIEGVRIYVFPTGVTGTVQKLVFTRYKKLQDYDSNISSTPFPSYWTQAIIYMLAADLSHEYGLQPNSIVLLEQLANSYKEKAKGFSSEKGSLFIAPYKRRR